MVNVLYSILIGLAGLLIVALVTWFFVQKNSKEPESTERKWTDPKFHD